MSVKKGTITFKDLEGNFATMRFKNVADLAASTTLKAALAAFSDCLVRSEALIEKNLYTVVGAGNVDEKAIITAQDSTGEVHKWALPGFNGTPVRDKEGDKVDPDDLTTILAAISTATGLSLAPLRSPVIKTR